jgi:hypothetical protein
VKIVECGGPLERRGGAEIMAAELAASPAWFPLEAAGAGMLRLVRLEESAYRQASFLDQRILATNPCEGTCSIETAAAAAGMLHSHAHYIFHIGHVGSTLISRLLGEHPDFLSVREPALLRTLASGTTQNGHAPSLTVTLALLARTWRTRQRALIKATSFVSEIAESILAIDDQAAALFVYTPALAYLRCILGGPNSRLESRALAPSRLARLQARTGGTAQPNSEGEWIAMSWLCEMTALCQAAAQCGPRGRWFDFDSFLSAPAAGLKDALRTLGAAPATQEVDALLAGPWMGRYAKAPEHAYDPALRRSVLEAADQEHRSEICRGMDWLARAAGRHPYIDAALAR